MAMTSVPAPEAAGSDGGDAAMPMTSVPRSHGHGHQHGKDCDDAGHNGDKEGSTVTESRIERKLREALPVVGHIEVQGDGADGCGAKFTVLVVSTAFEGKPLLARHRMVNEALKVEMELIHALSMKTLTPAQWESQQKP